MASEAQTCANRRNALKSTGPQTTKKELRKIHSFIQNEPNFKKAQMNVTSFDTGKYVKLDTWVDGKTKPKQTQFEPKTNPIYQMPKMNVNTVLTRNYEEISPGWLRKNKPKTNPISNQAKPEIQYCDFN